MSSCADLVDLAVETKERTARQYLQYGSRGRPGLRPLAASLAAQEAEHAAALGEIKLRGNLDLLFRAPAGPPPGLPVLEPAVGLTASEFLAQVLGNCDTSVAVYSYLESHCQDSEVSAALRRLADEALRTRVMVASRHDLETLGGA